MKLCLIQIMILTLFTLSAHAGGPFYSYPQTGQTACYDTNGLAIDCTGTGQDGDLKTGMPWPNPRFSDNSNGTVTDNLTGLIWLKNANCFGAKTWDAALTSTKGLATPACGLTDGSTAGQWRLPSIVELESLVDQSRRFPALPMGHPFAAVVIEEFSYLSGSTDSSNTSYRWSINMDDGNVGGSGSGRYVWPVRNGQ